MLNEQPKVSPAGRYNESEAARILGVTKRSMMHWRADRKIIPCHIGTRVYYKGIELIRFWNTH